MNVEIKLLEGRPHLVVPVVMITQGTFSGSHGPVTYPAQVLEASARSWNAKPIVVYHPSQYGHGFADSPEVFSKSRVGTIFHTRFEDFKLKAEAWLDVARLEAVDVRIANAIRKGQPVEVSTGVVVEHDGTAGNGGLIARHLVPDHLAILPTGRGACSIADGAGLMQNQNYQEALMAPRMFA
jgi:hypothetical protein